MIKFCTNLMKRLTNLVDKCLCKVNIEDIATTAVVIAAVSFIVNFVHRLSSSVFIC